jgi:hypothetical protein
MASSALALVMRQQEKHYVLRQRCDIPRPGA